MATATATAAPEAPAAAASAAGLGGPAALLVVDAQVGVLAGVWDRARVMQRIGTAVARARSQGAPVFWIQHQDAELVPGSAAWALDPHFVPATGETLIRKRFNSSFAETDLDRQLKAQGIRRVVLAGAATNWCIRATAYAALERGYDLSLLGDAHSTEPLRGPGGATIPAASIITDLNTVMRWIQAPGVRTEVLPAAEVDFR